MRKERPFRDLTDFAERLDPKIVGKRVLESLAAAGALDCFGFDRAALFNGVERMLGLASRARDDEASGQTDFFGLGAGGPKQTLHLPESAPWLPAERLQREFAVIGFYLSAHPLDDYKASLAKMRVQTWTDFAAAVKRGASAGRLAGTVTAKQERKTKTGNRMGIVQLSDTSGQFEAVMFSEVWALYRDVLEVGKSYVVTVAAEDRPEGVNLRIGTVQALDEEVSRVQRELRVFLRDARPLPSLASQLGARGDGQVSLIVLKPDAKGEIEVALPEKYRLSPQLASALRAVPGVVDVELV